jgi:tetratricopeptide (TPR) repeat protein
VGKRFEPTNKNMKKHRIFVLFIFLLLFSLAQTPGFAKDEWIKVRSKNFYMIGNAADKDIRRVANKLEQFRVVFSSLFPSMKFTSAIPTTVIVFKSEKAFNPYKPINAAGKTTEWAAGYFQPSEDINYIVLSTEGEKDETYRTIFHEYVHFLVDNTLGRANVPPWFNEGLAEYYEQFSIENDQKVTLGGLNQNSLYVLGTAKWMPIETLFNIDYLSLHQQGNHGASIFYAQSWALVHYMIQGNGGAKAKQVTTFLNLLAKGIKTRDAFQQAFQMTYADMETELKKYVAQGKFFSTVATFQAKLQFETDMQTSPMTDAEAKANLGDLLSHSRRLEDAEAQLTEALAMDPGSAMANSSMGLVKMRQRKFDEAKKYLEKAVAEDQQNFMVYFRYAYALSREYTDPHNIISPYSEDTAKKMRAALTRSVALNPGYAESYSLLAMISLVRNENIEEGVSNLEKAIALAPGNQSYQINLASLYMNREQYDKARPIIENIIRTADDPGLKAHAENMMSNLEFMKAQIEEAKKEGRDLRRERVLITTEDKPPSPEEVAKLREELEREALISALRKPNEGETRILGYVSKIECIAGAIFYTIKVDGQVVRLQSKDFQGLNLRALGPTVETQIGCGGLKKEFYAILTYLPRENPKSRTKGELVSIEIVPEGFKL